MNFKNRGRASFLKILLRDSIDRLPLPPAFAKKYLETSNIKKQKVVLEIKSGVRWSVRYLKIKDKYYFMDGWLKFMKDNGLQMGMFLVFWSLSRRSSTTRVFRVYVYEPNGCLKEPAASSAGASNFKRKIPNVNLEGDDDSSENMHEKMKIMTRVLRKSQSCVMPMKNSFVETTGISGYRSVQLRNDKGMKWDVKLTTFMQGLQKITRMGGGWSAFRKDNKIKVGNICEFYHVKSNLLHVRVLN